MRAHRSEASALGAGLARVTAANLAGNSISYLLLLFAARVLMPSAYSELVTLLNLLLAAYVPTMALQAVAARRWSQSAPGATLTATVVLACVGSGFLLLATAPLVSFLHLHGSAGPLLVAATLPGAAAQGWCQGVWQGCARYRPLALTTFVGLMGRSGAGLAGLLITRSAIGTMLWVVIGTTVAGAGCIFALRTHVSISLGRHDLGDVLVECTHAAHAYGAFLLLTATDLLLARHLLPTDTSAVYAAGSVLTRIAAWLPQSAASVLFASLTRPGSHRDLYLKAVTAFAGLGVIEVLGTAVLNGFVARVVGGGRYPSLTGDLWLFATVGALLSIIQFSLVAGLATRNVRIVSILWVTILVEASVLLTRPQVNTVRAVIGTVVIVCGVACLAAVLGRRRASTYLMGAGQSAAA